MERNSKILDYKDITNMFGIRSKFFIDSMNYLEKKINSRKREFNDKFEKWKRIFTNIYGESVNDELFLKHTYFALVLKVIIITKLCLIQNLDFEDAYDDYISNNLEIFKISEFEYFNWVNFSKKLVKEIFTFIEYSNFAQQDLFHESYQQIIYRVTRHKIGEFYTPIKLVQKMVNDFYENNKKILDPSCGSGNFIIEIIIKILNSKGSNLDKYNQIQK
ncbi:MAG: N-6 DNA methylase, partial [Promethearchaeota archaeon]